ncbi:cilia- and flagella-associated protein 57-like [Megalops cyprinoides]|uniref:cilia- and flagella-associated protein 57-like n=1 Tax=Megalops cyprinoides TaxID=118141 RepID=UPI0018651234|nr:cilia- and flagella-associated protein 57-like [Megalops cyprinoides]
MAEVVPHLSFIFGLRAGVANNLYFLDEQTLIFPAGNHCVCFNIEQTLQRFIPGKEGSEGMLALAISPDRHYLAISERFGNGIITVFDLQHEENKKIRALWGRDIPVQEFVCMAFSHDSKYLIGQSGPPDWILFLWLWETQQVIATVKTAGVANTIHQVSFNPQNSTQICVCGNGVFKLFRYFKKTLEQVNVPALPPHNFLSHSWMSATRVITGTDNGQLLVFESGDLCLEMNVATKPFTQDPERCGEGDGMEEELFPAQLPRVTAIAVYSKGFACSAGPGVVCLFEKMEDKDNYRRSKQIQIPSNPFGNHLNKTEPQEIVSMCISPLEATLATSTDQGQLYSISLFSAEMSKGEQAQFDFLSHSFHSSTITDLSICIHKPFIATCSQDRAVHIWNYETRELELRKEFQEETRCIALHPSGLFILVGFPSKLRVLKLLMDNMRPFKEFELTQCTECAFSHGGHMFAAVSGKVIYVYSTTAFDNLLILQDHKAKVFSIIWSEDDSRMMSCCMDGAVYKWNTVSGKLEAESVHMTYMYSSFTVSPDAKTIYAVGTDCTLKEIEGCQIVKEVSTDNVVCTAITLSRGGRVLFIGTISGTVRAIGCPLSKQKDWIEYQGHASPVTKMVVTFDDQFLVTISEDRCLLIWKLVWKKHGLKRDKEIPYLEEILISKSDMEEKFKTMLQLEIRVAELKKEKDYQLQLRDISHKMFLKEVTEKLKEEIESLKSENEALRTEKEKQRKDNEDTMEAVIEKHAKELQDLKATANQRMLYEYEMYHDLHRKYQHMQEEYKHELQSTEERKTQELEELTTHYESKQAESLLVIGQYEEKSHLQKQEYEAMIKGIEKDADQLIVGYRGKYERTLKEERDANMQLQDETGIMRKKFGHMQKEIDDKNKEIGKLKAELQRARGSMKALEKDMQNLKVEIKMRNLNIEEKERDIGQLKEMIADLEKNKFLQDHKMKGMMKQIKPNEKLIEELKDQIKGMEGELEQYEKQTTHQELKITELKLRLKAADKDRQQDMQRINDLETLLKRFKADLHYCVGFIQEPKRLMLSMILLYDCYIQQSDLVGIARMDVNVQKNGREQEEIEENVVACLKRTMAKDSEVHHALKFKMMKENAILINEINSLRRKLKLLRDQARDYESRLHITKKEKQSPAELKAATKTAPVLPMTKPDLEEESEIPEQQGIEIKNPNPELLSISSSSEEELEDISQLLSAKTLADRKPDLQRRAYSTKLPSLNF